MNEQLESAIASLKAELQLLERNAREAVRAIDQGKAHRLAQFSPSNLGRIQRLIGEIEVLRKLGD